MAYRRTWDTKAAISLFNTGIWRCVLQASKSSSYVERLWSWVVYTRQNDREVTSSFQNTEKVQGQYINTGHNYCKSWTITLQAVVLFEDLGRDGHSRFVYFRNGKRSQGSIKKEEEITTRLIPRERVTLRLLPTSSNNVTHMWGFEGINSGPCVIPFCWIMKQSQCVNRSLNFEAP